MLDSTWVDLYSEHIICYALVQNYTWSNEYEIFTTVQAYNSKATIKISPQLSHSNYGYELFHLIIEKNISKFKEKTLY